MPLAHLIHEGFDSNRRDTPMTRKPESVEVSHSHTKIHRVVLDLASANPHDAG